MTAGFEVTQSDGVTPEHLTIPAMQEIVGRLLPDWLDKMRLQHWNVTVVYAECSDKNWSAMCERNPPYHIATITLDPQHHHTEEDVKRRLIHELLHIKLWPFDLYREVMTQNRKPDMTAAREESALWTFCVEQAVIELRRMEQPRGLLLATPRPERVTQPVGRTPVGCVSPEPHTGRPVGGFRFDRRSMS